MQGLMVGKTREARLYLVERKGSLESLNGSCSGNMMAVLLLSALIDRAGCIRLGRLEVIRYTPRNSTAHPVIG